ncbi:MAG: OmpA family protein [Actinobacteria bacterium]|uniref:Unannotated protein n=1 Tax=freshwater metagenome TaxID=449393 RepID=A0A6J6QZD2_9ZZZZ|nr:OmpA family protein [Actinomycetota bacterium]
MSTPNGARRRPKHEEHEEHENHERWLVTYADMVTLLMVLFIVMFAMSSVDQKKFAALKEGLAAGFGESDSILEGNQSIHDQPGEEPLGPVGPQISTSGMSPEDQLLVSQAVDKVNRLQRERAYSEAEAEVKRLDEVRDALMAALEARGLERDVKTSYDERGLVVSLVSRHVVFEADVATLTERGREVVDTLAPVLREISDPLEIDGHTNQVPVKPKYYATDWDLSAARALTVLRRLNEVFTIPADRLRLAAFGHVKPLMDPSEPGSQAINKRVDIVVLSSVAAETAQLLPEAAGQEKPADTGSHTDTDTDTQTPTTETETDTENAHAEGAHP